MKEFKEIREFGKVFKVEILKNGKQTAIEKDIAIVKAIFDKGIDNLTSVDRMQLLSIYNVAYHDSGKIEGVYSFDSSATNCEYCAKMREYATKHPEW